MKRLLVLLLSVAMLFSFAGCGSSDEDTTASAQPETSAPEEPAFSLTASRGLEYALSEDGLSCIITGIGECTDLWITIPDTLEGCPVTEIAASAFYCNDSLLGIRMGENVVSVGDYAFFGCDALTVAELNDGLLRLGQHAFSGCIKISEISLPESVQAIGQWAFYDCYALTAVHISDLEFWYTIQFEGIYANPLMRAGALYVDGELLTELILPEEVTVLGAWTFAGCQSLERVQLHENVAEIGQRAFMNCENLKYLDYSGTAEQWKQLVPGSYWDFGIDDYVIRCQDKEFKG